MEEDKKDSKELNDTDKIQNETPKKIEVITGDGNLTISPVYEHLEVEKPKPKENRTIVIPVVKKDVNNKENDEE